MISPAAAAELVPPLRRDGLRAAGLYADAQTDDARLTLANLRGAADAGAVVVNRAELVGLGDGLVAEVQVDGDLVDVAARAVVNATGAWIDEVRRLEDPTAATSVTLSKGSHLVLERSADWAAAVTIPVEAARVVFATPWAGALLLGTTDAPFDSDLSDVLPTEAEEQQILDEVGQSIDVPPTRSVHASRACEFFPPELPTRSERRAKTTLSRGRLGMLSVAGGKLTTYRRIALAVLHSLRPDLDLHRIDRRPRPLPGAADPDVAADALQRRRPDLPPPLARRLAQTYGTLAEEAVDAGAPDPLAQDVVETEAEVLYARDREWAMTTEDVLQPTHDTRTDRP